MLEAFSALPRNKKPGTISDGKAPKCDEMQTECESRTLTERSNEFTDWRTLSSA
jgi:hypothetical protein